MVHIKVYCKQLLCKNLWTLLKIDKYITIFCLGLPVQTKLYWYFLNKISFKSGSFNSASGSVVPVVFERNQNQLYLHFKYDILDRKNDFSKFKRFWESYFYESTGIKVTQKWKIIESGFWYFWQFLLDNTISSFLSSRGYRIISKQHSSFQDWPILLKVCLGNNERTIF